MVRGVIGHKNNVKLAQWNKGREAGKTRMHHTSRK